MAPALSLSAVSYPNEKPFCTRDSSSGIDSWRICGCLPSSEESCSPHRGLQTPLESCIVTTRAVSGGPHACLRVPACNSVTPFGPTWPSSQLLPHTRPHLCVVQAHCEQQHCLLQGAKLTRSAISGRTANPSLNPVFVFCSCDMCDGKAEAK